MVVRVAHHRTKRRLEASTLRYFGVPLDLAGQTLQTFIRGKEQYGGAAWSTMIVKLLEDALKTDLRAPGFPASLETGS